MAGQNLALTAADLNTELNELLTYYKSLKTDGWTIEEIYSFIVRSIGSITRLVGKYNPATDDLKATVLAAFDNLYDNVIAPIDIPYIPNIIETRFVDPLIKKALHKQVSGILDGIVAIFKAPPATPATPLPPPPPPVVVVTVPAPVAPTPPGWKPY